MTTNSSATSDNLKSPLELPSRSLLLMQLAELKTEFARRLETRKLLLYRAYPKQAEFHAALALERLLIAANQVGKTHCGGAEVAMHLTGMYPDWWVGKRFTRAVRWLAGSESAELTRKGIQRTLIGSPEQEELWGTGLIP